jgi:hypothetical protein
MLSIHSPAPLSASPHPRGPGHPRPSLDSHAPPCAALASVYVLGASPYCRCGLPFCFSREVEGSVAWNWAVVAILRVNVGLDCAIVILWYLVPALASCATPCRVDWEGRWVVGHGAFFSTSAAYPSAGETRVQCIRARRSMNGGSQAICAGGDSPAGTP